MNKINIFIVDDHQIFLDGISSLLEEEEQIQILGTAHNGKVAIDKIAALSSEVNVVLMDINMPGMDGYTLTAKIREMEKYSNIPIVAVTANVMRGDREKSLEAGCDGYIQKPIDIDTLAQQIERFITRRTNV